MSIRTYKLRDPEIKTRYQGLIAAAVSNTEERPDDLDTLWIKFKDIIKTAAAEACGEVRLGYKRKRTPLWTEEVKEKIREKKMAYLLT